MLGVVLMVAAGVVALVLSGALRWRAAAARLHRGLEGARAPQVPGPEDLAALADLPPPVQRYLRAVLRDGQAPVHGARIGHRGSFNLGGGRWRPFTSRQRVAVPGPGFVWDARIALVPGLSIRVHDAYLGGEGVLEAALLGLFRVVGLRGGGELAEGELLRYLAEAVWYPTALLPGPHLAWTPVDERSAEATLRDGPVAARLRFTFGADGLVETVHAAARPRLVGGRSAPAPWQGRFWDYAERDGTLVPLQGEVAWIGRDGPEPYWRGRVTALEYEVSGRR